MNKKEIVSRFLESGLLLSPEVLDQVNEKNIDEIIDAASNKVVVTGLEEEKVLAFAVKMPEKRKLAVKDFAEYYNNRFEKLRSILSNKTGAVSINKLSGLYSDVSVIGMIKEITRAGIVLEDRTGEIEVLCRQDGLQEGDVIGINGTAREGKIFANDIIFPDVPLTKEPPKINVTLGLTTKNEAPQADIIITSQPAETENHVRFTLPVSRIKIIKGAMKANILVYSPNTAITQEEAKSILKKRYILPAKETNRFLDAFLLEPLPEIIWLVQDTKWQMNYRGVVIISTPDSARVELNTYNVEFL